MTVDSGAAETVTVTDHFPEFTTVIDSESDRKSYILPNGAEVKHHGEKMVNIVTKEGSRCAVRRQVTDINKSLMSVSRICDTGHSVIFEASGGYIEHLESKQKTCFDRNGGVYVLRATLGSNAHFQ